MERLEGRRGLHEPFAERVGVGHLLLRPRRRRRGFRCGSWHTRPAGNWRQAVPITTICTLSMKVCSALMVADLPDASCAPVQSGASAPAQFHHRPPEAALLHVVEEELRVRSWCPRAPASRARGRRTGYRRKNVATGRPHVRAGVVRARRNQRGERAGAIRLCVVRDQYARLRNCESDGGEHSDSRVEPRQGDRQATLQL